MKKVMYRSEAYSGSGVRETERVIAFETGELLNGDILEYVAEHYALGGDRELLLDIADGLEDCGEADGDAIAETVVQVLGRRPGGAPPYALWLAGEGVVRTLYEGTAGGVDAYEVPDDAMVLSDLGAEGTLYGFFSEPVKLGTRC